MALPILERNGIVFHSSRLTFTDSNINSLDGQRRYRLSNVTREETGSILRCYMGGFFSNSIALTVVGKFQCVSQLQLIVYRTPFVYAHIVRAYRI